MTYLPASSPPVRSWTSAITDRSWLVSTWDTQVNANDRFNADANRYRQFLGLR
jgi:hypothetical protein